jgi:flagellar protein FlgJ
MIDTIGPSALARPPDRPAADDPLWMAAQALEQNFLSEMLKSAGVGEARGAFGGGIGEEQFASYLREAQATAMTEAGGIGLAERLFHAITERSNDG